VSAPLQNKPSSQDAVLLTWLQPKMSGVAPPQTSLVQALPSLVHSALVAQCGTAWSVSIEAHWHFDGLPGTASGMPVQVSPLLWA